MIAFKNLTSILSIFVIAIIIFCSFLAKVILTITSILKEKDNFQKLLFKNEEDSKNLDFTRQEHIYKLQQMIIELQKNCANKDRIIEAKENEISNLRGDMKIQKAMNEETNKTIKAQGKQICRMVKIMDGLREP